MKTQAIPAKGPVKRSNLEIESIERRVVLEGMTGIMFDRYAGDNNTKLEPWQKMYLSETRELLFPSLNILSFLSAHNTNSAPKRLRDKRHYKDTANACLSFVNIKPEPYIQFKRNGDSIVFGKFDGDLDSTTGIYVHRSVARLDKGIPNPKVRPVLPIPWSLEFWITILPNREIKEQEIMNLFDEGGRAIGLGTFRCVFGKFRIAVWE